MALNGLTTSIDFLPTVRFNARDGVFNRADRVLDANGNYSTDLTDITLELTESGLLIDLANAQVAWIRFEGMVDIVGQHHSLGLPFPKPSDLHKEGVLLHMYLPEEVADGAQLREFTHTSKAVINSVNALHTSWELAVAKDNIGDDQVPHVKVGIEARKTKNGTFKRPVFNLNGFVDRPLDWPVPPMVAAEPALPALAELPL